MSICIFPGTFNPIHIAHIKMAQFVLDKYGFEKIIFIPAYVPPHKQVANNLAKHRYNMVKLVTDKNPKFEVSDIEYRLGNGKSYTIDTVKYIKEHYNISERLNLLIGTDAFENIKSWYKSEELKDLVHFIVFPRGNDIINPKDYIGYSFELAEAEKINVSSTDLREFGKGETLEEVKEYINKNELYI